MSNKKTKVFLVDDDAFYLKSLEIEFKQNTDFEIKTFATGELCIENLSEKPDVVILDYYLNSVEKHAMNGIKVLDKIMAINHKTAVIMLSVQDRVEVATNCMKHNAFDYVVKSETAFVRLKRAITSYLHYEQLSKESKYNKRVVAATFIFVGLIITILVLIRVFAPLVFHRFFT